MKLHVEHGSYMESIVFHVVSAVKKDGSRRIFHYVSKQLGDGNFGWEFSSRSDYAVFHS